VRAVRLSRSVNESGPPGVEGAAALRALFKVAASKSSAPAPRIAQDAGGLDAKFPGATRFRNA